MEIPGPGHRRPQSHDAPTFDELELRLVRAGLQMRELTTLLAENVAILTLTRLGMRSGPLPVAARKTTRVRTAPPSAPDPRGDPDPLAAPSLARQPHQRQSEGVFVMAEKNVRSSRARKSPLNDNHPVPGGISNHPPSEEKEDQEPRPSIGQRHT